jgi:hypothetical protein
VKKVKKGVKGEQARVKDKNHRGIVRRTSQSPSCVARPENPFISHPILLPCLIVGIPASAQIFSAYNTTDSFHPMSHDRHLCSSGKNKGMNQPSNRKTLGTILGKPLCGMFFQNAFAKAVCRSLTACSTTRLNAWDEPYA